MKRNWLFLMLCGILNTQCYTYRVINRTQNDIKATLKVDQRVLNRGSFDADACRDKYLHFDIIEPGQQVTKTWGGINSACRMTEFYANSSWRDIAESSVRGRAGDLTFLVFSQGGKGPFIQWNTGIRDAWDPTDEDKRRPYPGDKPKELPVVEVKN